MDEIWNLFDAFSEIQEKHGLKGCLIALAIIILVIAAIIGLAWWLGNQPPENTGAFLSWWAG